MEIPPDLLPHAAQVPPSVKTPEDQDRFRLCFALGRLIAGRDDPMFVRQLYASDIKTGDLASVPEPESDGQLRLGDDPAYEGTGRAR